MTKKYLKTAGIFQDVHKRTSDFAIVRAAFNSLFDVETEFVEHMLPIWSGIDLAGKWQTASDTLLADARLDISLMQGVLLPMNQERRWEKLGDVYLDTAKERAHSQGQDEETAGRSAAEVVYNFNLLCDRFAQEVDTERRELEVNALKIVGLLTEFDLQTGESLTSYFIEQGEKLDDEDDKDISTLLEMVFPEDRN